jgi:glucosamine--fructose-6-phosphate aminotransferase (isomerizing)
MELAAIEKGGYDHFMIKEIFEQPSTIFDCLRGRLDAKEGVIRMSGVDRNIDQLINANRIMILACGTSWHAGLIAEYIIEELCRIPVEVEYASEFRYRNPVLYPDDYDKQSSVSNRVARMAVKKAMEKIEAVAEPAKEEKPVSGLMARKQKEVV